MKTVAVKITAIVIVFHFLFGPRAAIGAAIVPDNNTASGWVTPVLQANRLQHRTFDSNAVKTKVSYFIYVPESYDATKERRFPVLYWLHGSGGVLSILPGLVAYFDAAIRSGKTPAMLVVFPNGLAHSWWCDSKDGKVPIETVIVRDLLQHIDATFRTIASRSGRSLEGFSMGGYGAARLGFKYPDLFGAVSLIGSAPLYLDITHPPPGGNPQYQATTLQTVYGGDPEYFKAQSPWTLAEKNGSVIRDALPVRQFVGDRDFGLGISRDFEAHLGKLNIPHSFTVLPGVSHDPIAVLNAIGEEYGKFYQAVFGPGK